MPETREELLFYMLGHRPVHCTSAEEARAVLSFCREEGLTLYKRAEAWLDSSDDIDTYYPNVRYSEGGYVLRCSDEELAKGRFLDFKYFARALREVREESLQKFEIDGAVFDSMFPQQA